VEGVLCGRRGGGGRCGKFHAGGNDLICGETTGRPPARRPFGAIAANDSTWRRCISLPILHRFWMEEEEEEEEELN